MAVPSGSCLLVVLISVSLLAGLHAGPTLPTLPASFPVYLNEAGKSIMSNAGASAGVFGGQVEGIPNLPVSGAVNRVLPHPTNPNIIYIGSVNGGIWKTTNALSANPHWIPLTDSMNSLSTGAIAFDHSDRTWNTLVVGIGSQSSISRLGGFQTGVLRTTDGGATWTNLGFSTLYGYRIAGIAAYSPNIVVCAVGWGYNPAMLYQNGATFLSQDNGQTWTQQNAESCTDMITEPSMPKTFFRTSLTKGLVVSQDAGSTWSDSIFPTFNTAFNQTIRNIRVATHNYGTQSSPKLVIAAGFLSRTLQGLYRAEQIPGSKPMAFNWVLLDAPQTNDNGTINGLNPTFENNPGEGENGEDDDDDDDDVKDGPGSQGMIHFSIAIDPTDSTIIYVGGDRQPTGGNATNPSWPNSLGAYNYDGRLFRCDSKLASGEQCLALTHMYALNNSAPHADSRHMYFDAQNNLIEADDGGLYKRLNPKSTQGAWTSLLGNLQIQEAQGAAYLGKGYFATGNQDTGTTYGLGGGNVAWNSLGQGDGAFPRIGFSPDRSSSVLYWSYPFLGGFSATYFTNGVEGRTENPELMVVGTDNSLQDWEDGPKPPVAFYSNYAVNRFNMKRLLFSFDLTSFVFESFDGGETVHQYGVANVVGQTANGAIVYGGRVKGVNHENLTYVSGVDMLALRNEAGVWSLTNYPPVGLRWPQIADVAAHPDNFDRVVVLTVYGEIAVSSDRGNTWKVYEPLKVGVWGTADSVQKRVAILKTNPERIVVSGRTGLYVLQQEKNSWWRVGGFPNAYINDMGYDPVEDLLWVSTLGRSVWKMEKASSNFREKDFKPIHQKKVPNWPTLTYVFAALTVVLFLTSLVFGIAFLRARGASNDEEHHRLINTDADA